MSSNLSTDSHHIVFFSREDSCLLPSVFSLPSSLFSGNGPHGQAPRFGDSISHPMDLSSPAGQHEMYLSASSDTHHLHNFPRFYRAYEGMILLSFSFRFFSLLALFRWSFILFQPTYTFLLFPSLFFQPKKQSDLNFQFESKPLSKDISNHIFIL